MKYSSCYKNSSSAALLDRSSALLYLGTASALADRAKDQTRATWYNPQGSLLLLLLSRPVLLLVTRESERLSAREADWYRVAMIWN